LTAACESSAADSNVRAVDHPFASPYKDRHGKQRWRYRRKGVTKALPGHPGDEAFEMAYSAALAGRPVAEVVRHPSHAKPRTLQAAWRHYVQHDGEFKRLRQSSKDQYVARAERFLAMEAVPGVTYADVPVDNLKRRHVKGMLGNMADRPHAAYDALVVLRKMVMVALDLEWIEVDPTHRIKYRPETDGHRAWTDRERAAYEARWPLGTLARTAYACVLYSGPRRSDVARFKWTDFADEQFPHTQQKTGKHLMLPVIPALREALDAAPRIGEHVLTTPWGTPRALGTLTNDFARWTKAAGLTGCTMHGLRKTLGKILAEEGATTRELMDTLGHTSISHAELYSREADQARMAKSALGKAGDRLRPRLRVVGGEPTGEPVGEPRPKRLK
jgi:integrase